MKTLQRKLTIILTFIVASAMLAIGLLCVYKPIKTRAETTTAVIDLGGERRAIPSIWTEKH